MDETTVEASPPTPPIGLPIDTLTSDGAIELNGKTHAIPAGDDWAQLLVLDRRTLEAVSNQGFDLSLANGGVGSLADTLDGLDASKLVVLSGGGRGIGDPSWCLDSNQCSEIVQSVFARVGAGDQYANWSTSQRMLSQGSWSVIGVPGTPGSAHANLLGMITGSGGGRPGSLHGYLQLDSNDNYTFVSSEATTIDTNVPGAPARVNRIRVGSQLYDSEPVLQQGGFHVLVLDSQLRYAGGRRPDGSLAPVTGDFFFNETFTTNTASQAFPVGEVASMQKMIAGLSAIPGLLVIVQSIGQPAGFTDDWVNDALLATDSLGRQMNTSVPNNVSAWSDGDGLYGSLAGALGVLGGAEAHDQVAQTIGSPPFLQPQPDPVSRGGYTLIASTGMLTPGQTETASAVPVDPASTPTSRSQALSHASEARVVGSLSRDRQSLWKVDLGTSVPGFGLESGTVAELAYQEPTDWPLSSTEAQRAANAYIARRLKLDTDDVREAYYEDSGADWAAKAEQLAEISYPGIRRGFTEATFTALKKQLSIEMPMVASVMALIEDWQQVWTSSTVGSSLDLQSIARKILVEIEKLQQVGSSTVNTEYTISDALWVADGLFAEVPGAGIAIGVAAGGLDLVADTSSSASGAPSTLPVQAEASQLGALVASRYEAIASDLSLLGEILVSDWGKLQQASKNASGAWAFNTEVRNAFVDSFTVSAKREFYAALLAAAYRVYVVDPRLIMGGPPRPMTPPLVKCQNSAFFQGHTRPLGNASSNPASWLGRPVWLGFPAGLDPRVWDPPQAAALTTRFWFGLQTEAEIKVPDGNMTHNPDPVPQAISAPLFEPLEQSGGLGIDKVSFFADSRFERYWFWCQQ